MNTKDAIMQRRSIRGYTDQKVEQQTLREVLQLATRAVSGVNCQPWEFVVATGKELEELRACNVARLRAGHEGERSDVPLPGGVYLQRKRSIGKALLIKMGIARDDYEGRAWWGERGYRFFDAPAVIFLLMDEAFDETAYRFDMGCVAQNICIAAMEYGLGTCVEDQAVRYQKDARRILGIPNNKRFVAGIAIGYPDMTFPANQVVSEREPVDHITCWKGF